MKTTVFLIICCSFFISCSQQTNDSEDTRYDYYPSGAVKRKYHVDKNNLAQGKVVEYYENGDVWRIKHRKNDEPHGYTAIFSPDGKLESRVHYTDGVLDGHAYFFYPSGTLEQDLFYMSGTLKVSKIYYADGKIKEMASYDSRDESAVSNVAFKKDGGIDPKKSRYLEVSYHSSDKTSLRISSAYFHKDRLVISIMKGFDSSEDSIRVIRYNNIEQPVIVELEDSDYVNGRVNIIIDSFGPLKVSEKNKLVRYQECETFYLQLDKNEALKPYNIDPIIGL